MNTKKVIGLIKATLKWYEVAFGKPASDHRTKEIIKSLIGDMPAFGKETDEVIQYCKEHYNF